MAKSRRLTLDQKAGVACKRYFRALYAGRPVHGLDRKCVAAAKRRAIEAGVTPDVILTKFNPHHPRAHFDRISRTRRSR